MAPSEVLPYTKVTLSLFTVVVVPPPLPVVVATGAFVVNCNERFLVVGFKATIFKLVPVLAVSV